MKKAAGQTFDQQVSEELKVALSEIGKVEPWFDDNVQEWVFEHPLYPESCSGSTENEVIKLYPLYLRQFIEQRMKNNLAPSVEKKTRGRGGMRAGAGRPTGSVKNPTRTIRLPIALAEWIKSDPEHLEQVRRLADG
jgi:hypothetical protein